MNFFYKRVDDGSFSIVEYEGNEKEVFIPKTHAGQPVTVLYDRVFRGHEEIVSIEIPDTVTDIGAFVFDGCSGLRSITLPARCKYLWQYAFCRSSIEEITLPEGIRTIAPFTFKDCRNLKKIVCNKGLVEIQARAFEGCSRDLEICHEEGLVISPSIFG